MSSKLLAEEKELVKLVYFGEVRSHEGIRLWRRAQERQRSPRPRSRERPLEQTGSAAATVGTGLDESALSRVLDSLNEAYRRLTRPDQVGRAWTSERWAMLSQVLAKLRTLANIAKWNLASPAQILSSDPKALAETGVEDTTLAGQAVDSAEALVDARVLRIAVRLVQQVDSVARNGNGKGGCSGATHAAAWVSPEVVSLAGMVLTHLRSITLVLEQSERTDLEALEKVYSGLASGLSSLRRRLGKEAQRVLQASQDPLQDAAKAASSLGVSVSQSHQGWASVKEKFAVHARSEEEKITLKADSFARLHQATLLSCISSFAELGTGDDKGLEEHTPQRVQRLLDSILHDAEKATWSEPEPDDGESLAPWHVEFTSNQLRAMQDAVQSGIPKVAGAQTLMQDTLNGYAQLSSALGLSYTVEKALRANPAKIREHEALVELVLQLQEAWRDSGALLTESRQADLVALERTRTRHSRLVVRAYRIGGEEMATMVLARLLLVDEMLLPPAKRRLTGEMPFTMDKPYRICQAVISGLEQAGRVNARRRRRWLRCPHANMRVVLAGEVWRQLMERHLNTEAAFDPLNACMDLPLSLREFRIAASFLEVNLAERVAGLLYEVCADMTGSNGEATLYSLQKVLARFGARGCGQWGKAAELAAYQLKHAPLAPPRTSLPVEEATPGKPQANPGRRMSSSMVSSQVAELASELKGDQASAPSKLAAPEAGRRSSSGRRMSSSMAASQVADLASELKSEAAAPSRLATPEAGRRGSSGRRMSSSMAASQVAELAQELKVEEKPELTKVPTTASTVSHHGPAAQPAPLTPMVCPRCLKGDLPTFPYVSVGELTRSHVTAAAPMVSPPATAATAATTSDLHSSCASASDSFEGELSPDDPQVAQELGEDIILSWATGVLTDGIVLCKDERGDYFRWLARIVLYDMLDEDVLQERAKSREESRPTSKANKGGKRTSFVMAMSATATANSDEKRPSVSENTSRPPEASRPATSVSLASLISNITDSTHKAQVTQKKQADQLQQMKEAERDWSIPIPDVYLARMRVDLGVKSADHDASITAALRNVVGEEATARRRSIANNMLLAYGRGAELQQQKRAEREVEMIQRLQSLVQESEVQALKKELAAASQAIPTSSTLLVGGSAQLAQRILVPRVRAPVVRHEQDEQANLKQALAEMRKDGRTAADLAAHAEVRRMAKEIVHLSAKNATQCYNHAGFDEEDRKNQVAAALRLLEHELFPSDEQGPSPEEGKSADEEQSVYTVAPLLLAKPTAKRLLKQARKELEAQEVKEAVRMETFRRKARVKETLSSAPTTEIDSGVDSDDSARSDLADCGEGNGRARRRWSDQRLNDMLQRDWSPINSPSPRVTAVKMSPAKGLSDDVEQNWEFHPEKGLAWHPTVQRLLASVSGGSQRLRSTLRPRITRCQSDTKVSLPAVSGNGASPRRGRSTAIENRKRKNEGWRAKVGSSPDVGSVCGSAFFPNDEPGAQ